MKTKVCPECRKHNEESTWSCVNCGRTLSVSTLIEADDAPAEKEQTAHESNLTQPFAKPIHPKPHTGQSATPLHFGISEIVTSIGLSLAMGIGFLFNDIQGMLLLTVIGCVIYWLMSSGEENRPDLFNIVGCVIGAFGIWRGAWGLAAFIFDSNTLGLYCGIGPAILAFVVIRMMWGGEEN
ncbi:MAG: hypothetical protein GY833_00770 [Aestuariibacter sp.]|nr:hypothetical protein [Aestuariibacter sp.]